MTVLAILLLVVLWLIVMQNFADAVTAQTHPFCARDLWDMTRVGAPQVAPDGETVVFTCRVTDFEANKGRDDLWLINADGTLPRRLTSHPAGSNSPQWAADGKTIYFLSKRTDSTQVWRIRPDGGEAEQVTNLPLDVGCFRLSPAGQHLAVSLEVFPDADHIEDTKQRLEELERRPATGRIYDCLFIRHWDTWKDGRRSHLFVLPLAGGTPSDVTKGLDADVPSKPFGDASEFTFTPDGKTLVFAARHVGREEAWSTRFDLYTAPIDGSAPPTVLVDGQGATVTGPVFAPNGKLLAYRAMARAGYEADRFRVGLLRWPRGKPSILTEKWDRSAGPLTWSPDSETLYTCADNVGQHSLFAVDVATGDVRTVVTEGRVSDVVVAGKRLVYGLRHLRSPVELYSIKPSGDDARPVTNINGPRLAAIRMGEPEQFSFSGWNDEKVYAHVVKPVDFDPDQKYPVAFLIHGGPQGSFGNDFHYRWNPQVYAGAGYAVVMVDFHGSTGYGQAFTDAINNHWGDRPLEDLQKGLAAALGRYTWMDAERIAALGASYGGYMVNWLHGIWPGRFRCLVCHDGNIDERMAYYATEELWFPEWERGGTPWEQPEAYTHHNPIDHVDKWNTPTLVIHSQLDYRVVDTQGIATFTALQRRGVPSRLLYFPNENHWVLKPANSLQWHEEVLGWLDRWTKA